MPSSVGLTDVRTTCFRLMRAPSTRPSIALTFADFFPPSGELRKTTGGPSSTSLRLRTQTPSIGARTVDTPRRRGRVCTGGGVRSQERCGRAYANLSSGRQGYSESADANAKSPKNSNFTSLSKKLAAVKTELPLQRQPIKPEAAYQAYRDFGGLERWKERCRDVSTIRFVEDLQRDLWLAFRMLRKSPIFSCVAVATLTAAIGANTTIFSLINAVLLKPVDVPHTVSSCFGFAQAIMATVSTTLVQAN
jgi:hypothetical protein